jgi:hypothetical protein
MRALRPAGRGLLRGAVRSVLRLTGRLRLGVQVACMEKIPFFLRDSLELTTMTTANPFEVFPIKVWARNALGARFCDVR